MNNVFGWITPQNKIYIIKDTEYATHQEWLYGNSHLFDKSYEDLTVANVLRDGWTRFINVKDMIQIEYYTGNPNAEKQIRTIIDKFNIKISTMVALDNEKGHQYFDNINELFEYLWEGKVPIKSNEDYLIWALDNNILDEIDIEIVSKYYGMLA